MEINFEDLLLELSRINGVTKVALIDSIKKKVACGINLDENNGPLIQAMIDIVRTNIKYTRLSSKKCFEDILITYSNDIHLLTAFSHTNNHFIYINIVKSSNIALTRLKLNECLSVYLNISVI